MLYLNVKRIATLRNIPNLFSYLKQNGFTTNISHRIISNSGSYIRLHHLEKLCLLFRCTPNDILQWQQHPTNLISDNEPITTLNHPQTTELTNYLKTASIEELTQMHQKIITNPVQ
jgi:DNA-binding Xre family transcriptional regulator